MMRLHRINDILSHRFQNFPGEEFPHPEFIAFMSTAINRFIEMAYQVSALTTCVVLSELDVMIRESVADGRKWTASLESNKEKVQEFQENCLQEFQQIIEDYQRKSATGLWSAFPVVVSDPPASTPVAFSPVTPAATPPGPVPEEDGEGAENKYDGTFGYIRSLTGTVNDEMITIYLLETAEQISAAEQALLALEADPSQSDLIHNIFRILHTIKGNSGLMGFHELAKLTHAMEQHLEPIRNKRAPADSISMDLMLTGIDLLTRLYGNLQCRYRQLTDPNATEEPKPVEWRSIAASFEAPVAAG